MFSRKIPRWHKDSTPLDLLEKDGQKKLTSDNISNSADDGEISIEQAFDKVLSVKDKGSVDGAYKELPEKPVQKIQETEFNIDSSSNLVPKKSPSSVSKDNSKDSNVSNNLHSEKSKNLVSSSNAYGKAKIGRRKISDVGLAAIGVGELNSDNGNLNSLIWRGTSADKTVFLLERASVASRSVALTRLAYRAVARQTVPPSGANLVAADLVLARLSFLANGGRSGDLALLAEQLPDGENGMIGDVGWLSTIS